MDILDWKPNEELAEILGLLCSEGCHVVSYGNYFEKNYRNGKIYYRINKKSERIEFYNKDLKLVNHYAQLLSNFFTYVPKITKNNKINIGNRRIIKYLLKHTVLGHKKWNVPNFVNRGNNKIKISFIRGFFDGDGTVVSSVRIFSVNRKSLQQVSNLLSSLFIEHNFKGPYFKENRQPSYYIYIKSKHRDKFLNMINPISKN